MTRYSEHEEHGENGRRANDGLPHGRLRYTPRGERSSQPGAARRRRPASPSRASQRDASAYSRDRYAHRPDRTEDGGAPGADPSRSARTTADRAHAAFAAHDRNAARPDRSGARANRAAARSRFARPSERPAVSPADEFSRDRAHARYAGHERHVSDGRPGIVESLRMRREEGERRGRGGASGAAGALALNRKRIVAIVIAIVLAVLVIGAIVWYAQVSAAMKASEDVSSAVTAETPGKPYYVLVLGSDKRPKENGTARADTIMLCRVDEANKKVTMVSLPRDLRVQIEGHGYGKLNSALAYNGFSGMIRAASNVAGVPISYYAVMYFSGFKKLVNDLGGVEVDVPAGTYYHGTWVNGGKEGKSVHINGKEALVLARCRHGNPPDQGAYAAGDYQRTKNQRNLMKAIVKKIMGQPVFAVPGQVLSVVQCVETNMPAYKLAMVALAMRGIDTENDMYSATAPATSQYIDGVSYQILDDAKWQQMMARVEAGEDPNG